VRLRLLRCGEDVLRTGTKNPRRHFLCAVGTSAQPHHRKLAVLSDVSQSVESRMGAVAWAIRQRPVSQPRSSNRTCRSPAFGFRTGFTARHTTDGPSSNVGVARRPRAVSIRGALRCFGLVLKAQVWPSGCRPGDPGGEGLRRGACLRSSSLGSHPKSRACRCQRRNGAGSRRRL
jgi:hypothetical protein